MISLILFSLITLYITWMVRTKIITLLEFEREGEYEYMTTVLSICIWILSILFTSAAYCNMWNCPLLSKSIIFITSVYYIILLMIAYIDDFPVVRKIRTNRNRYY